MPVVLTETENEILQIKMTLQKWRCKNDVAKITSQARPTLSPWQTAVCTSCKHLIDNLCHLTHEVNTKYWISNCLVFRKKDAKAHIHEIRRISCEIQQISWNPPKNLKNQITQQKLFSFMQCSGKAMSLDSHEIRRILWNPPNFMKSAGFRKTNCQEW